MPNIEYARSSDGVAFAPQGTALTPGEGGAFDSLSVLYPAPLVALDQLALLYTGFDGQTYTIGSVNSSDGGESWQRPAQGELLANGLPEDWDNAAVAQPLSVKSGQTWMFWYGGYDTSLTNPGPWRVGAAQQAGSAFGKVGVSLPLSESGHDAWSTRDPAVVPWGDGWLMVYAGMGDDGIYRLLRATSDVCN